MPTYPPEARPPNMATAALASTGLQLLSPTFQQSIQSSTSTTSSSSADIVGWTSSASSSSDREASFDNTKPTTADRKESVQFDSDGFTLESVYGSIQHGASESSACLSSSTSCAFRHHSDDYDAFDYDKKAKVNPLSSSMGSLRTITTTEDFERSQFRRQNSVHYRQLLSTRFDSSEAKRDTFHSSPTAAAAGFPMAKKKQSTAIVMRGWLQKLKGLVLKRWKSYYCLFKSDDSLCLYASQDTINGKLVERYRVLRVVLTDKLTSFHLIGVTAEGVPRCDELRVSVPSEWNRWCQVFGRFFDASSMEQAFVRVPQLTFAQVFGDTDTNDSVTSCSNLSVNDQCFDEQDKGFSQKE